MATRLHGYRWVMRNREHRDLALRALAVVAAAVVLGAGMAYALADRGDYGGGDAVSRSAVLEESAESAKATPAATATAAAKRREAARSRRARRVAVASASTP